jgi:ribonucleotide monophosphatase NagD (HAD superfamily)
VGDRLETDIAGARAAGLATALVLTGVHGRPEAAAAVPAQRPDMIVDTLEDLTRCWE